MRRQQHDRQLAVLFDLAQLLEHVHVDVDLLEHILEGLVHRPRDHPDYSWLHLAHQLLHHLLCLLKSLSLRFLGNQSTLRFLECLRLNRFDNSARGEDLRLHLRDDLFPVKGDLCIVGPFDVGEVGVLLVEMEQVRGEQLGAFVEDVLLDSIVVYDDELLRIVVGRVDHIGLSLLRGQKVPQSFKVPAFVDPFVEDEKLEYL